MRTSFGQFTDAGMNLFPSGPNQSPSDFLDLTNVLPSTSGGFRRRWGLSQMFEDTTGAFSAVRTFFYNVPLNTGNTPPTTQRDLIITTDNQNFRVVSVTNTAAPSPLTNTLTFNTYSGHGPSNFSHVGNVGAVTSRNWFYYLNGIDQPRKVCPGDVSVNTDTNWGIQAPFLQNSGTPTMTGFGGTGTGYTGTPTVTISGGGGTGATATAVVNANGSITGFTMTNVGSGYTSTPTVSISGTGTGAQAVAVYNNFGAISAVLPAGPIQLNSGRTYTYAWQSSVSGHTSDIANGISSGSRIPSFGGVVTVQGPGVGVIGNVPPGPGFTAIYLTITPVGGVDTQVDTLILLATADGGTLQQLYEVTNMSVTAPNPTTINYTDVLPDSYSDTYITGLTLLNSNLYVDTDGAGNTFGIANNTPPPVTMLYPTVHQGRMFGTDGLNLYFSKSLTEVTTSTGLISSKWEEAWPGTNIIPIGLDNEFIVGLRSSGQTLHIATSKAIYELQGSDPTTFSIPSSLFQETGILTQDLWTVVYSQGQPTGAAFITPDLKMVYSDYNTFQDVSVPVYPLLSQWASAYTTHAKLNSFSWGPYNFVVLTFAATSGQVMFMLFETTLQKWFRWETDNNTSGPLDTFVYEHPETGYRGLYYIEASGANTFYRLFDPTLSTDNGGTFINWSIKTAWTSLSDPLAFKSINEIELISDETHALTVDLWGANSQADFDAGANNSGSSAFLGFKLATTSPLGTVKTYWAGVPTASRYFVLGIFSNFVGTVASSPIEVLTHFIVEHFPMVRF